MGFLVRVIYFLVLNLFTPVYVLTSLTTFIATSTLLYKFIQMYGYRTKQIKKHVRKHIVFTNQAELYRAVRSIRVHKKETRIH